MLAVTRGPYHRPVHVAVAFGTRPEVIKLAPVIAALADAPGFRPLVVSSGQHTDLLAPFVAHFGVQIDHELNVMEPGQPLNRLFARVLTEFDAVLAKLCPTGDALADMLNELHRTDATAKPTDNPFGDGHAAERIVHALAVAFGVTTAEVAA